MPPWLNSPAIMKAAIQTTGFLVANCCFYVSPTTTSLEQNKDPSTKAGWCPTAQVHHPSKGFPTESWNQPLHATKKTREGPLDHPPSSELTCPSQFQSPESFSLRLGAFLAPEWLIRDGAEQEHRDTEGRRGGSHGLCTITYKQRELSRRRRLDP